MTTSKLVLQSNAVRKVFGLPYRLSFLARESHPFANDPAADRPFPIGCFHCTSPRHPIASLQVQSRLGASATLSRSPSSWLVPRGAENEAISLPHDLICWVSEQPA